MRKACLIAGLLALVCLAAGAQQRYIRRVPPLPFARLERNALQFPGGESPSFERFLKKLDTLLVTGRGDVRIVQVGGSHVQGGTWTGQLRNNLLSLRYGMDGGRGLVFPCTAAATNTPSSYRSAYTGEWTHSKCLKPECAMGLCGMAVSTQDSSATVIIDLAEAERRPWSTRFCFKQVDLFGYGDLEPVILLGRDTVAGRQEDGRYHFELPRYTDYVEVKFRGFPGRYTVEGLYLDRPGSGLTVSEAGVNGAATASWLRCEDFTRDLAFLRPDLVIFSIGINDIQGSDFNRNRFIDNYKALGKQVLEASPGCALLFTVNNDSWSRRSPNPFTEQVEQAFGEIAAWFDAPLWDLYEIMGGYGSMQDWTAAGLGQSDKIHFTPEGYRLLGDLLFNAIMDCYRK